MVARLASRLAAVGWFLGSTGLPIAAGAEQGPEATKQPYYFTRGANVNRSGASSHVAPFPLPKVAKWQFEDPKLNMHQTPVIDGEYNVYSGSDIGRLFSIDKNGKMRWDVKVGSGSAQNPTLFGGVLYTATADGWALAVDPATGNKVWGTQVSDRLPGDAYTVTAVDDWVILPAGGLIPYGCAEVVVLDRADGKIRWRFSIRSKYGDKPHGVAVNGMGPKYSTANLAPCVYNGSIIFNDVAGGVYRLSLADGKEIWHNPAEVDDTYTLGSLCCGPNGKAYIGYAPASRKGMLRVLDIETGKEVWRKGFNNEIHAAPAVGYLPNGQLAAVVGVGLPTWLPPISWLQEPWRVKLTRLLGYERHAPFMGMIYAVDAETGDTLWTFAPPLWFDTACAGSTWQRLCLPDLWSQSSIDASGTVFVNWSAAGVIYGLRDANRDGVVDLADPLEVTSYDGGSGITGPPALAPGVVLAASCRRLIFLAA